MDPVTTTQTAPVVPKLPVLTLCPLLTLPASMTKAPAVHPAGIDPLLLLELLDADWLLDVEPLVDVLIVVTVVVTVAVDPTVVVTVAVDPMDVVGAVDVDPWSVLLPLTEPVGVVPVDPLLPEVTLLALLDSAVDVLPLPDGTHRFAMQLNPGWHAAPAAQTQLRAPTVQL
jgi:hypothetical protein